LAVGEQVLVTRNDYDRGLLNGQRATVTAIGGGRVRLQVDDQQLDVPAGWAGDRLTSAYALTIHKAQGLTVDVALVDATAISDGNTGYVALSRARCRTEIHHSDLSELTDALVDDPLRPRRSARRPDPGPALATRISRFRNQQLATEHDLDWRRAASGPDIGRSR
jgi:hypothetical protein